MTEKSDSNPALQFLVAPRTPDAAGQAELQRFIGRAAAAPDANIVRQVGTPVANRLVVTMTPALAESLRKEFGALIIEEDAPLRF